MSCSATSAAHDKRKEAPSTARPGHRGPAVELPSANWTGHWSAARAAAASRARFLFVDAVRVTGRLYQLSRQTRFWEAAFFDIINESRAWFNGRTGPCQGSDEGSIPF